MNIKILFFASYTLAQSFVSLTGMKVEAETAQYLCITFETPKARCEKTILVSGLSLLFQLYPECNKDYNDICSAHGTPQENSQKDKIYRMFESLKNGLDTTIKTTIKNIKCGELNNFFTTSIQKNIINYIAFQFSTPIETKTLEEAFNNVFNSKTLEYTTFTYIEINEFESLNSKKYDQQTLFSFNKHGNDGDYKEKQFCSLEGCNIL